jgi:hypothetical protein
MRFQFVALAALALALAVAKANGDLGDSGQEQSRSTSITIDAIRQMTPRELEDTWYRLRLELSNRTLQKKFANRSSREFPAGFTAPPRFHCDDAWKRYADSRLRYAAVQIEHQMERLELHYYDDDDMRTLCMAAPEAQVLPADHCGDEAILESARAVVAIVDSTALTREGDGWRLKVEPLRSVKFGTQWLCLFSRFYESPSAMLRGTGVLVAPNMVVTAGHVMQSDSKFLNSLRFLFGYAMDVPGELNTYFSMDEVYKGRAILVDRDDTEQDWAMIELDTCVTSEYAPAAISELDTLAVEDEVYMIGHPNGMPQTLSGPARVVDNEPCTFFASLLDTYPLNSGSPVFNARTHELEGILTADLPSYRSYCNCVAPALYSHGSARPGAHVMRSRLFAEFLEHPDSIEVQHSAKHVGELKVYFGVDQFGTADSLVLEPGDVKRLSCSQKIATMKLLQPVPSTCLLRYDAAPGDRWYIVDGNWPGQYPVEMVRCRPDTSSAPSEP